MPTFDYSLLIHNALQKLPNLNRIRNQSLDQNEQDNAIIEDIIAPLSDALLQHPSGNGSADALHLIGVVHMATLDHHRSEMSCLLVHRFRNTLIDPSHRFNSLVNLTRVCINLKSFDEAFQYAQIGETINEDDLDLKSNMTVASYLSGRKEDARKKFEDLKKRSPTRAAQIHALVNWRSNLEKTSHLSCDDLVEKFEDMVSSRDFEGFKLNLAALQKRPDGNNAWRCWRSLCKWYIDMKQNSRAKSEYLYLQSVAGVAAASGKAIAFHPDNAIKDTELRQWRHDSLRELDFNEIDI